MANILIKGMILNRADTEANWMAENPILAAGEIGVCTDKQYLKVGNGVSPWSDLKKFQANIVEDSLNSSSPDNALSARMGKELADRIGDVVILDTDENANLVEAINSLNQKITILPVATPDKNGLMSQEDKEKLDGIEPGANNYTHTASHPISMIEELQEALDAKQDETDLSLITEAKTITGAINETAQNVNLLQENMNLSQPVTVTPSSGVVVTRNDSRMCGTYIVLDIELAKADGSSFATGQNNLCYIFPNITKKVALSAAPHTTGSSGGPNSAILFGGRVYSYTTFSAPKISISGIILL